MDHIIEAANYNASFLSVPSVASTWLSSPTVPRPAIATQKGCGATTDLAKSETQPNVQPVAARTNHCAGIWPPNACR